MRAIVNISMLFGMAIDFRVRFDVDDVQLSQLHHDAFGGNYELVPWGSRLHRHSKSWVGAFHGTVLCGFVNAAWDGGKHAFLLDTAVATEWRSIRHSCLTLEDSFHRGYAAGRQNPAKLLISRRWRRAGVLLVIARTSFILAVSTTQ